MEAGPSYEEWLRVERAAEERNRDAFTGAKPLDWLEIGTRGQFVPLEEPEKATAVYGLSDASRYSEVPAFVVGRWGVEEPAEKVSETTTVNEDGAWVFRTEFVFR